MFLGTCLYAFAVYYIPILPVINAIGDGSVTLHDLGEGMETVMGLVLDVKSFYPILSFNVDGCQVDPVTAWLVILSLWV